MKLAILLLLSLALPACSTTAPAATPAGVNVPAQYIDVPALADDSSIKPPKVTRRVEPLPPASFIGSGRFITAGVGAVVGADGRVKDTWIASGDPEWGRAVAAAIRQWEFQPAMKDGSPIAVRMVIDVTFRSSMARH